LKLPLLDDLVQILVSSVGRAITFGVHAMGLDPS